MARLTGRASKKSTGQYTRAETIQSLEQVAASYGIKIKEKKDSLFKRTMDIISRPLYASANVAEAAFKNFDADITNDQNILQEAWNGFSGKEKTTYSDVLKTVGIENKYAKGIIGFALDVALDPSTYFGGAIVKGAGKVAGKTLSTAGKVGKAVGLGEPIKVLEDTSRTLKDGLGKLFVSGYGEEAAKTGAFQGMKITDSLFLETNKLGIKKQEVLDKYVEKFGNRLNKYKSEDVIAAGKILWDNNQIENSIRNGAKGLKYITTDNKLYNEILEKLKTSGSEIGDLAVEMGLPKEKVREWYFAAIKDLSKPGEAGIKALTTSGQKYFQKNKGVLKYDDVIQQPVEALARRELEMTRDLHNQTAMLDIIDSFGHTKESYKKLLKSAPDEAAKYVPVMKNRKSAIGFYKTLDSNGKQVLAVGKPTILGYLKKTDLDVVDNWMNPENKTIDLLAKSTGYDKFTNFFKGAVTSLFPAFHVRNMLSGHVQNYSVLGASAFDPRNISTGLALSSSKINKGLNFAGFKGTTQELRQKLLERFKGATRYVADLGDFVEETIDGTIKFKSNFNPMQLGRNLGGWIEFNQKANATTAALRQGKTLEEAMNLAEKAGFNYAKITPFEAKVMRRLIPFYTFARKNAELQLRTAIKNPERILNQVKFANGLSNIFGGDKPTEEELAGIPPWALDGLGFKLEDGKYVSKFGFPIEDFISRINDPIKSSLTSLNPMIKFPLEAQTGYDLFRGRQIVDINQSDKMLYDLISNEKTPQWLKDVFSVTSYEGKDGKTKYTADSKALHLLRNLPTSRLQSTLSKVLDGDMDKVNKYLAFFSGMRIEDIDQELQANFREKDLMKAYQDELKRRGLGFDWNMFLLNNEKLDPDIKSDVKAIEKEAREANKLKTE